MSQHGDGPLTLLEVLERARAHGFLGPGPVERHVEHAEAFAAAVGDEPGGTVLDLGSGGGVPGLILAERWPTATFVLVDARARRTAFLEAAVRSLGWGDRVEVRTGRAETLGRNELLRHRAAVVVARSFGPPAVTAECGAPFLQRDGLLVVAEPPDSDPGRWPATGLALFGLADDGVVGVPTATVRRLRAVRPCGDAYPRPDGVPAKRPRF